MGPGKPGTALFTSVRVPNLGGFWVLDSFPESCFVIQAPGQLWLGLLPVVCECHLFK